MITKLFSEKINCFMIDEDVSKYESIRVFDDKLDLVKELKKSDIVIDAGDYIIYMSDKSRSSAFNKSIKKYIFMKKKIYKIDNEFPSRGIIYDESGEVLDIMNIWHDCVLFSEDKKTFERFLKIERII